MPHSLRAVTNKTPSKQRFIAISFDRTLKHASSNARTGKQVYMQ